MVQYTQFFSPKLTLKNRKFTYNTIVNKNVDEKNTQQEKMIFMEY